MSSGFNGITGIQDFKFVSLHAFCFPLFCGPIQERREESRLSHFVGNISNHYDSNLQNTKFCPTSKTVNPQRCLEFKSRLIQVSPFFIVNTMQSCDLQHEVKPC